MCTEQNQNQLFPFDIVLLKFITRYMSNLDLPPSHSLRLLERVRSERVNQNGGWQFICIASRTTHVHIPCALSQS